ncbi:MAG: ABC transporter permease, partial [Nocardioides sp.]
RGPVSGADTPTTGSPVSANDVQSYLDSEPRRYTGYKLLGIAVLWGISYLTFRGRYTLARGFQDLNGFDRRLNEIRDWLQLDGKDHWFFGDVLGGIGDGLNAITGALQRLVSTAALPWPFPLIGWLGVAAILLWLTYAAAGRNATVLVGAALLFFGSSGLWVPAMDLLIVTFIAVLLSVVIGLPLGIWMSRSTTVSRLVTPLLDTLQTLPSFSYLGLAALFFGIGPAAAIVLTFLYAVAPLIRITEHAMRAVPQDIREAARSLGLTRRQLLRLVELPMARRTVVVGVNQCVMAALSMATIAALVNGPGLGKPVANALQTLNVGAAAVGGLAIVVMAIVLDRTIAAASRHPKVTGPGVTGSGTGANGMVLGVAPARLPRWAGEYHGAISSTRASRSTGRRRLMLVLLAIPVGICVYLSRYDKVYAQFPDVSETPVLRYLTGPFLTQTINQFTNWFVEVSSAATLGVKDSITYALLNPLESLLAESPWWASAAMLLAVAYVLGGWRTALTTFVCEAIIIAVGQWHDAMVTLSMTVVATASVLLIAITVGVGMGRSQRADIAVRPFLDAVQTIPSMIYLVPALALFGVGRFTAIVAAIAYAIPIATKLVADGVRGVSPVAVEAARSTGSSRWQMITKVQVPMARESLVLAANQGLLYVLSVVVIGGLVGAGSLGYVVVSGFSQSDLFGKGIAAGITLTALGIMLDRITRAAAARRTVR